MNRKLLLAGTLIIVILLVVLWYANGATPFVKVPPTPVAATTTGAAQGAHKPRLAIDLYPIYADAKWASTTAMQVTIGTTTYTGASAVSAPIEAGMDPSAILTPFTKYYAAILASHGWHVANDLAAGGPMGGQDGYRNGNGVILVGYQIDYKNQPADAPVSCPCTVTLSLFSNVEN